jgi:hypothetical protein
MVSNIRFARHKNRNYVLVVHFYHVKHKGLRIFPFVSLVHRKISCDAAIYSYSRNKDSSEQPANNSPFHFAM